MSEHEAPQMDEDFPRWYRTVSLGDDPDLVQRRWAGLSALVEDATREDVEAMIRLAFKTRQPPEAAALERVRQAFKTADDLFEMKGNDRELEVLCGAALAVLCRSDKSASPNAALMVTSTAAGGGRTPKVPLGLVAIAEDGLATIAEGARERPNLDPYTAEDELETSFKQAATKIGQPPTQQGFAEAFDLAAKAVRVGLNGLARHIGTAIAAQDEELQMLWWLIGDRSWDFDCAFSAVPANARPLVLAKELASLTAILPGPASVRGLLAQAGLKAGKRLSIPATVNACDAEWLRKLVENVEPSPVTQPIHFAIKRKLETGEDAAWVANWEAVTELNAAHALSRLDLGTQFYRERLLAVFE